MIYACFLLLGALIYAAFYIRRLQSKNRRYAKEIFKLINQNSQSNAQRNSFLTTAGHDLQQPQQAVGLFLASIDSETLSPQNRAIINKAKDAHQTTSRLLKQLFDTLSVDTAPEPELKAVALHELIHAIGLKLMPVAASHGVELRIRQRQAYALTDAAKLEPMITNLLLNAFHHATNGTVLLAVRKITLEDCQHWRIEVYDSGNGIAEDRQKHIFHHLSKKGSHEQPVTGSELSMVRQLSDLLQHPVGLRSKVGRGSCFHITLKAIAKPG